MKIHQTILSSSVSLHFHLLLIYENHKFEDLMGENAMRKGIF